MPTIIRFAPATLAMTLPALAVFCLTVCAQAQTANSRLSKKMLGFGMVKDS